MWLSGDLILLILFILKQEFYFKFKNAAIIKRKL